MCIPVNIQIEKLTDDDNNKNKNRRREKYRKIAKNHHNTCSYYGVCECVCVYTDTYNMILL